LAECSQIVNIHFTAGREDLKAVGNGSTATHWPFSTAGGLHTVHYQGCTTRLHYKDTEESAKYLLLEYPAHDQARWETWPNLQFSNDPRWLWSFMEKIRAIIHLSSSPTGS